MLFDDTYRTLEKPSEALFKDRGSKFLGFAYPVKTETHVKEAMQALRKAHPKANHHCFAYRLGPDKLNARSGDDGEPSGTAGKPIAGQIQSHDLTDILIVVVRYFGGTLLGAGGLIQAYKVAAADAIGAGTIIEKQVMCHYKATFEFEHTSEVMKVLKSFDGKVLSQGYEQQQLYRIQRAKELFRGARRAGHCPRLPIPFACFPVFWLAGIVNSLLKKHAYLSGNFFDLGRNPQTKHDAFMLTFSLSCLLCRGFQPG